MVLGAVYTLWSFNRIFFGNLSVLSINAYGDLSRKEYALYFMPIVFMLFIGVLPHYLLDVFYIDCINILEHAKLGREL
jgi:NADH:ubiquinone oxidoreductase subunit 4 (subunit M)